MHAGSQILERYAIRTANSGSFAKISSGLTLGLAHLVHFAA